MATRRGRRSATAIAGMIKPYGRDGVWAAIRALAPEPVTAAAIRRATDIKGVTIRAYLAALLRGGYLASDGTEPGGAPRYRLARDVGVEAPRLKPDGSPVTIGRARENIWRTMRILSRHGDWSIAELRLYAATPETPVAPSDAQQYASMLARAGYLVSPSRGRWRLIFDTGPKPPVIERARIVFDVNRRIIVRGPEDLQ